MHQKTKKTLRALVASMAICMGASAAQAADPAPQAYKIEPQPVSTALKAFAAQSNMQLIFTEADVGSARTTGVVGTRSPREALSEMLKGTGLEFEFTANNVVVVRKTHAAQSASAKPIANAADPPGNSTLRLAQTQAPRSPDADPLGDSSAKKEDENTSKKKVALEEIVVTGTHIRGAINSASPIRTLDRSAIEASGVTTVEDLFKSVPENVGGIDVDTRRAGIPAQNGQYNHGNVSGVNLRGLGSDATLVLLNGHRMPIASDGFSADVSAIPLAAVDHVDILKDGASSIYGSDAVGGVVNFVTVQTFQGARTDVTGSTVTTGGKKDLKVDQLLGTSWDSGNIFGSYTFNAQGALSTADRAVTATAFLADAIPPAVSNSLYLSGEQAITDSLQLHLDVLASDRRNYGTDSGAQHFGSPTQQIYVDYAHVDNRSLVSNASLSWALSSDWRLVMDGQYSTNSTDYFNHAVPPVYPDVTYRFKGRNYGGDITADGPVFDLPAGAVRLALGASDRRETYDGVNITELSRNVSAGYAELFIPIVSKQNAISGAQRLEFTVSDRYDHYSDFGGTNNPKVGFLFAPTLDVSLRATYSTSFRAPLFTELGSTKGTAGAYLLPADDPGSPTGTSNQIISYGGNPNLKPETAHSVTAGLDFHPQAINGLTVSADFFHIDFKNRIEAPANSPFLASNPALYGAFLTRNPTAAQVEAIASSPFFVSLINPWTPTDVNLLVDDRNQNAAVVKVNGVDLDARLTQALRVGSLNYGLTASYLLKYRDTLLEGEAPIDRLNTPYYPTKLRLRATVGWSSQVWSTSLFANYVNSYTNNNDPEKLARIGSWMTFDGQVSYRLPTFTSTLSDTRISLSVQNIFDRQPPFVFNAAQTGGSADAGINYDPVNSSLLGRYVSLRIGTRW